ncbi:hypothetical protein [Gallaecimonas xiamenensis]|uniref:hypothetical protein n=1 Tax=Gallaecimonas xiamenensis TaxID=1207039 RepID=UPI0012EA5561|nr:hypothetical protein [Gallaecimonas xiamenensis]
MIREANPKDYNDMDSVFRASAKKLCIASYSSEVVEAWAGKCWPERFIKGASEGNRHYVLVMDETVVCFGSINLEKQLLVSLFLHLNTSGKGSVK